MKKILTLNIKQLRTEESFGYQKQVVAETANLPIGEETETPSGGNGEPTYRRGDRNPKRDKPAVRYESRVGGKG